MIRKGRLILALPLLLGLVALGCGKGNPNAPAKVTGTVTYQGNSVTAGTVAFHAKDGTAKLDATIQPNGTYTLTDAPIGEMLVTVETESVNPQRKTEEYKGGKSKGPKVGKAAGPTGKVKSTSSPRPGGAAAAEGTYTKIPEKYSDKDKSGLSVTLKRGNNPYDIDLK